MENKKKPVNELAKYSGMAFQLLAFIGVGYLIGSWVDGKMESKQPYGTALGATLFLLLGLVYIVRDILREK